MQVYVDDVIFGATNEMLCEYFSKLMQTKFEMSMMVSYPNFVRGQSFVDLLILANRLTVSNASYSVKQMIIQCFDQECERYRKEGAKESFQGVFWTLAHLGPQIA